MVVLPADHLINNYEKFLEIIKYGDKFIKFNETSIITLGINPNRPECGYGYIKI